MFCAKDSKQKLKVNGFENVFTTLEPFKKYNFFTSRFFSAVDFEYESYQCDPTIIMITDLVFAKHSMIDPLSEAIQIAGRFRRAQDFSINITKEIVHISNYDPMLSSMSRDKTIQYVHERYIIYEYLNNYLKAATNRGTIDALSEMIERSEYKRYINPDGSRNYFMQDNMIHQEQVNGFYKSSAHLIAAYGVSKYFNLTSKTEQYHFTDKDRRFTNQHDALKSIFEVIIPVLHEIEQPDYSMYLRMWQTDFLNEEYPKVVSAYRLLGYEKIKELKFNYAKIKDAIRKKEEKESMFGLLEFIDKNFHVDEEVSSTVIKRRLKKAIDEFKLHSLKPNVQLLKNFCTLSQRHTIGKTINGKEVKGYRIISINNKALHN